MNFQLNRKNKEIRGIVEFQSQELASTVQSPIWQAVVLLTTQKEVESGQLQCFVHSIPKQKYPIPLIIFLNHFKRV
jgi:hypothetical protein